MFFGSKVIFIVFIICATNGERISRNNGIPLWNLTKTHEYENNIVTSRLDVMQPVVWLYRGIREVYNMYVLLSFVKFFYFVFVIY